MGRTPTSSGRLSLDVDASLKQRAAIAAIKAGVSLTQLVERGLVLAMAELRGKTPAPTKRRTPTQLPLDEP
jgi:hypothetical protein